MSSPQTGWSHAAHLSAGGEQRSLGMNKLVRGGIAGLAAWKLGGGIIGTILLFLIVFYLLGYL